MTTKTNDNFSDGLASFLGFIGALIGLFIGIGDESINAFGALFVGLIVGGVGGKILGVAVSVAIQVLIAVIMVVIMINRFMWVMNLFQG